jgi:hypothetical protein
LHAGWVEGGNEDPYCMDARCGAVGIADSVGRHRDEGRSRQSGLNCVWHPHRQGVLTHKSITRQVSWGLTRDDSTQERPTKRHGRRF